MLGYEYMISEMMESEAQQMRDYEEYMIEQASVKMTDEEIAEMYEYFKNYMEV